MGNASFFRKPIHTLNGENRWKHGFNPRIGLRPSICHEKDMWNPLVFFPADVPLQRIPTASTSLIFPYIFTSSTSAGTPAKVSGWLWLPNGREWVLAGPQHRGKSLWLVGGGQKASISMATKPGRGTTFVFGNKWECILSEQRSKPPKKSLVLTC